MKKQGEKVVKLKTGKKAAALATALIAVIAALVFVYRDSFDVGAFFGGEEKLAAGEAFTYEAGSNQVYAAVGNALAVAGSTGVELLDGNGQTILRQVFSMGTPAIAANSDRCAFFDVGGTILRVAELTGEITALDTSSPIISVTVNDAGYIAVTTEETGYKGKITVYDTSMKLIYEWYSGSAYVLTARVSSGGGSMAALFAGSSGGRVAVLGFDSEEPRAVYESPGELFIDLQYMSGGKLCAVSGSGVTFLDGDCELAGRFEYDGMYLISYDISSDFAAIYLGKYLRGSEGILYTLDSSGEVLGSLEVFSDLYSLCALNKELYALSQDSLARYSRSLKLTGEAEDVLGVKAAVPREDGGVLLVIPYSVELIKLTG